MDVATLAIKVDATDVKSATNSLNNLTNAGAGVVSMLAKIGGAIGFALLAKQLFSTNVEFQRLSASLVTVTGSTEGAARAFRMIQDFAKTTPYELSELTQSFIDLKTKGMDASIGSLTSYGNMASAFGRSLPDLIRAVSGVAMGETEAIKSFGVQARTQGDQIAITFKGQTEIIKRTTGEVESYFKRLSDANFASGMERQSKTLGGVLSNLKDQVSSTFFAIGNAGVSGVLTGSILSLTKAIADATPTLAKFAGATVSGLASAVGMVDRYKTQIAGLVIVLGTMAAAQSLVASTTLAAGVGFVAQTARTVALTFAVSGYSVSATAAAIATTAWSAASMTSIAAFGLLAGALAALYLATRNLRKEMQEIDKEIANLKPWKDRAEFQKNFAEGTKDIETNIKTLRAALDGDKQAILEAESPSIAAYRSGSAKLGTEAFDRQIKLRLEAENTEKALRNQLDAKNQSLKANAEAVKKLHEDQMAFFKAQSDAHNKAIFSESELLDLEIKRLKIRSGIAGATTVAILHGMDNKSNMLPVSDRTIPDTEIGKLAVKNIKDLFAEIDDADPLGAAFRDLEQQRLNLEKWKDLIGPERFTLGMRRLSEEHLRLRAEAGDTWAIIGDVVAQNAGNASDATVRWMNNLDGLGYSWRSLGDTVRNVLSDMITQMQRAVIQQQLMQPLMNWAGGAIGGLFGSSAGASSGAVDFGTMMSYDVGTDYVPRDMIAKIHEGERIIPAAQNKAGFGGVTNNTQIIVNVASDGSASTKVTSSGADSMAKEIQRNVEPMVLQIIDKHMRPGGRLNPAMGGGIRG